eukprot:358053-Chlamydomonas_euryale.AAC.6
MPTVPGSTVKATATASPELFCSACAPAEFEARGFAFMPDHTLGGPDGFGTMQSTTHASMAYPKPSFATDMSNTAHAVTAGQSTTRPRWCPGCGSPRWVLHGPERCKCMECGSVY